jgi:hypothetical protein
MEENKKIRDYICVDLLPSLFPEQREYILKIKNVCNELSLNYDNEVDYAVAVTILHEMRAKGIGLKQIEQTELHKSLAHSFNALLSLGIDLKTLGK